MTFKKKETLNYVVTFPDGCDLEADETVLWFDVDRPRAAEVAKILRAIADSLDEAARK